MRKDQTAGNPNAAVQDNRILDSSSKNRPELIQDMLEYIDSTRDEMDLDVIDAYLAALQESNPKFAADDSREETEKIMARIRRNDQPAKPARRRPVLRVAAILVAVLVALTAVAAALGQNPFQWLSDRIFDRQNPSGSLTLPEGVEGEYQSFQEALDQNGFDVPASPGWIPADFWFEDAVVRVIDTATRVAGFYTNSERAFRIQVTDAEGKDTSRFYETEEDIPGRTYQSNGIVYTVYVNTNNVTATWSDDRYTCILSGELTETELENILDSIE